MPLTIRQIKQDLKRWNILQESYESFEINISETDQKYNCTINDYIVQIWINMKMEVLKCEPKDLLHLIPNEQIWFKKMLIKMIIKRKITDFSPVARELALCNKPTSEERDYLHLYYPLRVIS